MKLLMKCTYPEVTAQFDFCRGSSASAYGLTLPSPAKSSLQTSKERILLHHHQYV